MLPSSPETAPPDAGQTLLSARWMHRDGDLVVVSENANPGLADALALGAESVRRSPHFGVYRGPQEKPGATVVTHRLAPREVDNDLAELVAGDLVRPGLVSVPGAFERCFAGVVLSSAPDPDAAWTAFYANTLAKLESGAVPDGPAQSPTALFGGIYAHARTLVRGGSLLDVGTCFGFFPIVLARSGPGLEVTALDLSAPLIKLAGDAVGRLGAENVRFARGDALRLPFGDRSFDTVTALHVLEHLDGASGEIALGEMCRVARERVVVAVPLEEKPDPAYGHERGFNRSSLTELGEKTGWRCAYGELSGGWISLDRPG